MLDATLRDATVTRAVSTQQYGANASKCRQARTAYCVVLGSRSISISISLGMDARDTTEFEVTCTVTYIVDGGVTADDRRRRMMDVAAAISLD
jgi:hypothetical protein